MMFAVSADAISMNSLSSSVIMSFDFINISFLFCFTFSYTFGHIPLLLPFKPLIKPV